MASSALIPGLRFRLSLRRAAISLLLFAAMGLLAYQGLLHTITSQDTMVNQALGDQEGLLAIYRRHLAVVALAGSLLVFWISQRALARLYPLSDRVAAISPQALDVRLDASRQPPELQGLVCALNAMLSRLEAGYLACAQVSEDLAHEIRTPLHKLMLQNQLALAQPPSRDGLTDLLVSQQEEYQRLASMVDSMLLLARVDSKAQPMAMETVQLPAVLEQLSRYFEGMAQDKQIRIRCASQHQVIADADLLRRALANLVANAIQFGHRHSVIDLSSHGDGGRWTEIRVRNQGPVIPPEDLPRLFQRFYRSDATRADAGQAGGLGLAIVQSIMAAHAGEVRVHSDLSGTTFSLRFPRHA